MDNLKNLDGLKQAIEHFGRFPTTPEYNAFAKENGYPHSSSITKQTKMSWSELRASFKMQNRDKYKEEFIIECLLEAAKDKPQLRVSDYEKWRNGRKDIPDQYAIAFVFGSFNEAKRKAGLPVSSKGGDNFITKEKCKASLEQFRNETGKEKIVLAEYEEWRLKKKAEGEKHPNAATIRKRFGFLVTAVEAAGGHHFSHVDEQLALNHFLEFLHEHLSFTVYNKWAVRNGKHTTSYFHDMGIDNMEILRKAIEIHLEKQFRTISRYKN